MLWSFKGLDPCWPHSTTELPFFFAYWVQEQVWMTWGIFGALLDKIFRFEWIQSQVRRKHLWPHSSLPALDNVERGGDAWGSESLRPLDYKPEDRDQWPVAGKNGIIIIIKAWFFLNDIEASNWFWNHFWFSHEVDSKCPLFVPRLHKMWEVCASLQTVSYCSVKR